MKEGPQVIREAERPTRGRGIRPVIVIKAGVRGEGAVPEVVALSPVGVPADAEAGPVLTPSEPVAAIESRPTAGS